MPSIATVEPENLPAGLRVCTTMRSGGTSKAPFASLNLGLHVGDEIAAVERNRQILVEKLNLPSEPLWLRQTHSTAVCIAENYDSQQECDAAYTQSQNHVLAILTADCLPVAVMSADAEQYGVAHAGWRGLANGVLQNTLAHFKGPKDSIIAWLGPAIGPQRFEVGDEVRALFRQKMRDTRAVEAAFVPAESMGMSPGKWYADLYKLAHIALRESGVETITGGGLCTYSNEKGYFSYRRDGQNSGRMATLIWRN